MRPEHLIAIGAVLSIVGGAMVWASGATDRRNPVRPARATRARRAGALVCASLLGGVLAGLQWILLGATAATSGGTPVWIAVLGPPAFLAAATLVRVALAIRTALARHWRRKQRARIRGMQR